MPLCIVETMLGHHYPNADKSQQLVNYVEDYLECVESLPLDIQRNVSLLREIDAKYQGIVPTPFLSRVPTACVKLANINSSLTWCVEMVEQARALCSHFAKTEHPLFICAPVNRDVRRRNVERYTDEASVE